MRALGLLLLAASTTCCQQFEVASVHADKGAFTPPNFPLDAGDAYGPVGGRFSADFPLTTNIRFAYKLPLTPAQTEAMLAHLPSWIGSDRFRIEARAQGNPTKDQMRAMIQSLLADRFHLQIHFEDREVPVLALRLIRPGKPGPKLRSHAEGPACDSQPTPDIFPDRCDVQALNMTPAGLRRAGSRNTTLPLFAASLPGLGQLDRPVVDQTGLEGRYDFLLDWSSKPDAEDAPDFLGALREQLGLKLESARATLKTPVIDHVERPSEN